MRRILIFLPILLMIIFEVIAGVSLFNDPVGFTQKMIVIFGIFMLILGILGLIRALRAKAQNRWYRLNLIGAVLDLVIGLLCVWKSDTVLKIFPLMAMIYGVVMVIMGIYKIRNSFALRALRIRRPFLMLLSGVLSVILGVLVFLHPFTAMEVVWQFTGIVVIVDAVFNLALLIFGAVTL